MKNSYLFILILFAILAPAKALAADFSVSDGEKTFSIDQKTLDQWKGTQSLSASNVYRQTASLREELKTYPKFYTPSPAPRTYHYRLNPIYTYVTQLSQEVDSSVQEPKINIADGRAAEFLPPKNGKRLDSYLSSLNILNALESGHASTSLAISETKPQTKLSDLNSLGISELIARGTSNFRGSPKNRRHNIKVGVEKMKGIIVKPGGVFSFNEYLGEVDGKNGFLPELVIKRSGTVPEFGGGLCQVSSTTFRAAMAAGLPIKERRNHAYAVQYYAPQGTDATIYPGVVDLKFENDTPGHILIWPYLIDNDNLAFDIYGTKDSRQVTLNKPVQWDRKADGSMKAEWSRVVVKDGTASTSTFRSVYQPPALFHKEEQFVSNTTPPEGMKVGNP